jgi:hypothetical protein
MNFTPANNLAEVHLTYRCDLACIHCNRLSWLPATTPDMTLDDAKAFIDQTKAIPWNPTVFLIGGEPTLHPQFREFVLLFANAAIGRVVVWSNGYGSKAQSDLAWVRKNGVAEIYHETMKPSGSILHSVTDYFLAPVDYGRVSREPCISHCRTGCGISVDAYGYTICCCGGAIDGVLNLHARTKRLADIFDNKYATAQTQLLCSHCGCRLGVGPEKTANASLRHGSLMSPTWYHAVDNIQETRRE